MGQERWERSKAIAMVRSSSRVIGYHLVLITYSGGGHG